MLCKNASNVNSARGAKVARSAAVTPVRVCGERPPTVIIVMIIMMMTVHFVRCEWPRRIKLKRSAPMWLQLAYLLTLHFYCTLYTLVPRAFCCVFNYHFLPPFFRCLFTFTQHLLPIALSSIVFNPVKVHVVAYFRAVKHVICQVS